ncbi:hypothetical protein KFU94_35565 [Chloroflexi bacterium TSY]|nr:hypothetical protein [Chloroflexi bacterium TSY]
MKLGARGYIASGGGGLGSASSIRADRPSPPIPLYAAAQIESPDPA